MSDIKQSLMETYIDERLNQYEKFFASPLWRKSLLPFLKAHCDNSNRGILQKKDHMEGDIKTGMVLAFEQIINLPKAIEYRQSLKTNGENAEPALKLDGPVSAYEPDFDAYTPQNLYEGE